MEKNTNFWTKKSLPLARGILKLKKSLPLTRGLFWSGLIFKNFGVAEYARKSRHNFIFAFFWAFNGFSLYFDFMKVIYDFFKTW